MFTLRVRRVRITNACCKLTSKFQRNSLNLVISQIYTFVSYIKAIRFFWRQKRFWAFKIFASNISNFKRLSPPLLFVLLRSNSQRQLVGVIVAFVFFSYRSSSPKTSRSPKPASPPGTPSAGGASANASRQHQPQAARRKQRPKKKKGGWWPHQFRKLKG